MTSMEITPAEMLAQLRIIAEKKRAENGGVDYIYERIKGGDCACRYAVQTDMGLQASCIIGTWAHQDQGVPLEAFDEVEGRGANAALRLLGVVLPDCVGGRESISAAQKVATHVQNLQDKGVGWLAAVNATEGWVRRGYRD